MSSPKWTKEQQAVIDSRNSNLLVAAAAGSGKTAVLVERIIQMITDKDNPGDTTECTLLKQEAIEDVFEALYVEQNEGFLNLIESYAEKRGDSNVQDIILGIYNFSMASPDPKKWLEDSAEKFNIDDNFDFSKSDWAKSILGTVYMEIEGIESSMKKSLEELYGIEELETYLPKFRNDYEGIKRILDACDEKNDNAWNDTFMAMSSIEFENYTKGVKRLPKDTPDYITDIKKRADDIRKNAKKTVQDMVSSIFRKENDDIKEEIKYLYKIVKSISDTVLKFEEAYSNKKRDKGIIDFNDIEHFALKILIQKDEDGKDIPSDIALSYREKFEEIFIDEYQDSNFVQEVLLSNIAKIKTPNRFMVGDVKQSIYRFRQAKPELFLDKYNRYPLASGGKERKIQLYKNFRSRDEVLRGVNFIFKMVMSNVVGELEYTDDEALHLGAAFLENNDEDSEVGGSIELHMIDKSGNEAEEGVEEELQESEEEEVVDAISLEAKLVSKRIKELFETKDGKRFKVFDKETKAYRDVKYKDIVILLRATKNWSEIFLDELGAEGIPVYADTGSGYFESIEIRTIMSLLKIIDNPLQDVPMIAVLKSPIMGFTAEELSEIRLLNKEKYFYEIIKDIYDEKYEVSDTLKAKCNKVISDLEKWRNKTIYTPIDEFIWYLYMDTAYYGYVGAMPNGTLRQANLKILFQRAKQYESTSFKGLFNFITFINKLRKSSGDMGSAKILGENEDVVRIMSIHKSKGLEFPIVFTCGMGKQFNLMDLSNSILFHEELGFGPDFVNLNNRNSYSTLAKEAIKKRIRLETLSEEMRILYVAFTRAKEKLIITGATRDLDKSIKNWVSAASLDENIILPSEVLKGKSYLDWIAMAICKHRQGEELREQCGASRELIVDDFSNWDVQMWRKSDILGDKNLEPVDKIEENTLNITATNISVDKEIKRRLSYKYKYEEGSILPSNVSVSDLKRKDFQYEDEAETLEIFREKEIIKPKFLQEEKGFTAAEKGTLMHYVMLRLDFDRVGSVSEIKKQIEELVLNKSLTEKEAKVIRYTKIFSFFKSELGKRILKAHEEGRMVHRELPFFTEISSLNINPELNKEIYQNEKIRLQGIIDGFFKEEDGIVLFDYKTDYLEEGNEEEIIERYKIQMKYYKEALEKITESRVKEIYLYLFALDKEVVLEI